MNPTVYPARVGYSVDLSGRRLIVGRAQRRGRAMEFKVQRDQSVADGETGQPGRALAATGSMRRPPLWIACLPIHESVIRWLQAPLASTAKALKVLPTLLDIQLPFPLEDCVYQFLQVRRTGPGQVEGLAVAARHADVRNRIERLSALGFDPVVLDHEGLALWSQSLREIPPQLAGLRVVASLGADHFALVLGQSKTPAPAGRFISAHSMRPAEASREAAGQPSSNPEQAPWITRVRQILQAHSPDYAQQRIEWIWTGPGADDDGLVRGFQRSLERAGNFVFLAHRDPAFFLTRALATRALFGGEWSCNFRRGPLVHPAVVEYARSQQRQATFALATAGVILCGLGLAWPGILEARKESVQAALMSAAVRLAPDVRVPRGQELLIAQRALQEQAALALPFLNALQPPLEPLLADVLRLARQHRFQLDTLNLSSEAVSLRGTAEDWDRCELLARPFRERGYTVHVEREEAGLDEKVHFALKGGRVP